MLFENLTSKILKAFYKVNDSLCYDFLEKVYENSMFIELKRMGLKSEKQKNIKVFYDGCEVGDYYADLIVNDSVIVELKAVESLLGEHEI